MAKCVRCGERYPDNQYMCKKCGAPLSYEPAPRKRQTLSMTLGHYKNWVILVVIALVLSLLQVTAGVVGAFNWIIIIGLLIAVAIMYLRARSGRPATGGPGAPRDFRQSNSYNSSRGAASGPTTAQRGPVSPPSAGPARPAPRKKEKKPHNVIPFRKKK